MVDRRKIGALARWGGRLVAFCGLAACFTASGVPEWWLAGLVGISPLLGLAAPWVSVYGCCFAGMSIWRRRFFCRNVCPLGLVQDVVRKFAPPVNPGKLPRWTTYIGATVAVAALGSVWLGGASALWADPMALFAAAIRGAKWALLVLALLLVMVLVLPRLWCRCLCPCGGVQDVLWRFFRVFRFGKPDSTQNATSRRRFLGTVWVLALGTVLAEGLRRLGVPVPPFRPPGAVDEARFLAKCTRCGNCVAVCPTRFLVPVKDADPRTFGTPTLDFATENHASPTFCERDCVRCSEACPTGAIRRLTPEARRAVRLAKVELRFEFCRIYYQKECSICQRECPVEAIDLVWSEAEYAKIPVVDADLCTGCGRCIAFCPGEPSYFGSGDPALAGPKALVAISRHVVGASSGREISG